MKYINTQDKLYNKNVLYQSMLKVLKETNMTKKVRNEEEKKVK